MYNAIISGVGFGLLLAVLPGPVFFALIQTSIQKGFRLAVYFALGVALSDLLFILATYLGVSNFMENEVFKTTVGVGGGILMALFGLFYFMKPIENTVPLNPMQKEVKKGNFIIKGFFLNVFNPSVMFFWLVNVSVVTVKFKDNKVNILTFFALCLLTLLSMDILKSYISNRIKEFFTNKTINIINKGLGILLVLIGAKLIFESVTGNFLF